MASGIARGRVRTTATATDGDDGGVAQDGSHPPNNRKQVKALDKISVVCFLRNLLVYRKIFTDDYYPSGYSRRTGTRAFACFLFQILYLAFTAFVSKS